MLNGQFDRSELTLLQRALVPGLTPAERSDAEVLYTKIHVLLHGHEPVHCQVPIPSRWPTGDFGGREFKNGYWNPPPKALKVACSKANTPSEADYLESLAALGITL